MEEPTKALITVPAIVTNLRPRADRSWKLEFETRELSGDEVKILADNFQGEGWLLFKPNDGISLKEVPSAPAEAGVKSPSERLRDVLYIQWKQRSGKGDFESYYRTQIEKMIEFVKTTLRPE